MQRESLDRYCSKLAKKLQSKHPTFREDFKKAYTLLNNHLCVAKPTKPISPKRLTQLHHSDDFEVWKYQVMVQGLRPNQWPRMWVGVIRQVDLLVPLVLDAHQNNYNDSDNEREAKLLLGQHYVALMSD